MKGKVEHIKENNEFDHHNQYLYNKMDEKLKSVQNAMDINQDELVKKRIQTLEKIIQRAEKIG